MYKIIVNGLTFVGSYKEMKELRDQADRYGIIRGAIFANV